MKFLFELMHDISIVSTAIDICNLFTKTFSGHSHNTHSFTSDNFYIKASRLEIQKKTPFQELVVFSESLVSHSIV